MRVSFYKCRVFVIATHLYDNKLVKIDFVFDIIDFSGRSAS